MNKGRCWITEMTADLETGNLKLYVLVPSVALSELSVFHFSSLD